MKIRNQRSESIKHLGLAICLVCFSFAVNGQDIAGDTSLKARRDQRGCAGIAEAALFKMWKSATGPAVTPSGSDVVPLRIVASDGVALGGYQVKCCSAGASHVPAAGYLLFIQGNAMLAGSVVPLVKRFATLDLDVFVFDFRGYGVSEGRAKAADIIADYREIVGTLNARGYHKRFIYGISFGGAVILNAVGMTPGYDAMIVDSTPAKLPFFCPGVLDPVSNLPQNCSRILMISGGRDRVVPAKNMFDLIQVATSRGGEHYFGPDLCHPFSGCGESSRFAQSMKFIEGHK